MENNKERKKVFNNNIYLLKMCMKICPSYVILFVINSIKGELVVFLEFTFGLNYILECVEYQRPYKYVLIYLVFLFAFVTLGMLFDSWLNEKYKMKVLPKIKGKFKTLLYAKAKEVDLENYDNPEYYNDLIFSISESDKQIDRMFTLIGRIASSVTTFLLTGLFFILEDGTSLIFVLVLFITSYISNKAMNKLNYKIRVGKNSFEKKRNYIERTFYLLDYAKEMRLNIHLSDKLMNEFSEANDKIYDIEKKNSFRRFALDFLSQYLCNSFIHNILYMIFLLYRAIVIKVISYSNVVVLFKAATKLKKSIEIFSTIYPYALETSLYVERIKNFLEIQSKLINKGKEPFPEKVEKIEFRNVFFSYGENDNYIINNLSFIMEKNQRYALVGCNGAGKTTLIKLIMRMYDVTKGAILLNDRNIKEYNLNEYRSKMGVVFQDYKLYAASLAENVAMGIVSETENNAIQDSLKKSGFEERLKTLSKGLDTQITTEFDDEGVNLSGGEGQKVAVARAFKRNAPLFILDEPSSALDPISEYSFNKAITEYIKDSMTIFISHRLSTTRFSDCIIVLNQGQIFEYGTHEELLKKKGLYYEMWRHQSMLYIDY